MFFNSMQSDFTIWSAAILLSLLAHSMMFMQSGAQMGVENALAVNEPRITRLSFNQPADRPVLDKPRPPEKKPARPVKKAEPRLVKKEQYIEKTQAVKKTEPTRQLALPPKVQGRQVSHSSEGILQAKRQQYLHKLLSHIESFKFYPRSARRRLEEGEVKISFVLQDDGYYEQLELDGRQAVLVSATREALESARPLPVPPEDLSLSRQIEFIMEYSLTR